MREFRAVLLASASPRRRELLMSLGLRVLVMPTGIPENDQPELSPSRLAAFHAAAKADAVAGRIGRNVMVAADTVVDVDGRALGKPSGPREAAEMLHLLSGRDHLVHTAFVAVDGAAGGRLACTSTTRVRFARLGDDDIDAYVASGESFDKAGAYGIQGRGAMLVDSIEGDFYTVMGFPLGMFVRSLPKLGLRLAHDAQAVAAERALSEPLAGAS
jgi:septum formation protein